MSTPLSSRTITSAALQLQHRAIADLTDSSHHTTLHYTCSLQQYDHLDVTTLKHIASQPQGSVHFFAPLGNASWFLSTIGVKKEQVTELDWWGERDLKVKVGEGEGTEAQLRITATPCQHVSRRCWGCRRSSI